MSASEQAILLGEAWERTPKDPTAQMRVVVYCGDGTRAVFQLGVHAPDLTPEDLERIHRLWLDAVRTSSPHVHHRDIVAVALKEFEARMGSAERDALLARLRREAEAHQRRPA
jgi:hypothetical protein